MSYTDPCYPGLDALSDKRIVFLCDKLASIAGQTVNEQISLKNFFIPVSNSFVSQFSLESTPAGPPVSIELSYGNIATSGYVNAIFIFATYDPDVDDADKYMEWSWDEITWYPLGKILALSSANNEMLGQVYLRNPSDTYAVNVTVMIGN